MMRPVWKGKWRAIRYRKWLAMIASAVLLVALVSYCWSRLASIWRQITVVAIDLQGSTETRTTTGHLRCAAFNIAHGRGISESNWTGESVAEREQRLLDIAALLRSVAADVVLLNEVDFDASWSSGVNQARFIAREAHYPHVVEQRNLDFRVLLWTWRFGNAILSLHPVSDVAVIDLPGFADWETALVGKKRGVACTVSVGGTAVRMIGLHLSHRSEAIRIRSIEQVLDVVAASPLPTVVLGDLNSTPTGYPGAMSAADGGNAMDVVDRRGLLQRRPTTASVDAPTFTFPATDPKRVIDWILIPSDWAFVRYEAHPAVLSDHRLVVADMIIDGVDE